MSDLISRQDAIDIVHYYIESGYKCDIFQELKDLPSAEPERNKGKWLWDEEEDRCYCSECGEEDDLSIDGVYMMHDFCPNCGADMRISHERPY